MNWNEDPPPPPPQKSNLLLFLGTAIVLLAIYVVVSLLRNPAQPPPENVGIKHPAVGKSVGELEFAPLLDADSPLTSAELAGKVVLINYWGTWCPPCRIEFPHMATIEKDFHQEQDFRFVSVSVASGGDERKLKETTAAFLEEQGAKFPVYADPSGKARSMLLRSAEVSRDQFGYPATVVLGRDGKIRGFWVGYATGWEVHIADTIRAALKPQPPE